MKQYLSVTYVTQQCLCHICNSHVCKKYSLLTLVIFCYIYNSIARVQDIMWVKSMCKKSVVTNETILECYIRNANNKHQKGSHKLKIDQAIQQAKKNEKSQLTCQTQQSTKRWWRAGKSTQNSEFCRIPTGIRNLEIQ